MPRNPRVSALSDMPSGEAGRRTHWDTVEPLTPSSREVFQALCRKIVASI